MFETPCFKKPFESQHAKTSKTLIKFGWQHFYQIFQSFWQSLSWEMFLLKICEILWLFVNTLTTDDKYSLCYRESLRQTIQVQLSKKQKPFVSLMPNFRNLFHVLNILKKKIFIVHVFPKLHTANYVLK